VEVLGEDEEEIAGAEPGFKVREVEINNTHNINFNSSEN